MKTESPQAMERGNGRTIWVFTPSRTDPKDLEYILVQRQPLLQDAVERVRESALTDNKHHQLFVGPRGCGKTHLTTLIVSRLSNDEELTDKLRIAWLNEDETCTTLLELLVKVHGALEKRYPLEFKEDMLGPAYDMKPDAALEFVCRHLLAELGSRTLLLATENLDAIFEDLGEAGQKQFRSFIQENPKLTIVATAQRLVEDLSDRNSPFFGFFQTEHLKPLTVEQATELLQNIARLQEKDEVVEFLATGRGRSRVRAIHHLSGGNHRIYIVLSQFITRDSIDALLGPFMKMVDELTPYYQERIRWLPPLQRKIVEYLCICEGTVPVKEIARRLFTSPPTISSQLLNLREKGYVEANQRGRESLYEISEPLMRICVEVKDNQRHQPLRLLVDFLRVWYDDEQLEKHLGKIEPASLSCAYLESAIQRNSIEGNLRKHILLKDFQSTLSDKLPDDIREGIVSELKEAPEGVLDALKSLRDGNPDEAMIYLDEAILLETRASDKANLLLFRAELHLSLGDKEREIFDYTAIIELPGAPNEQVARALLNRGVTYGQTGDTQRSIEDYTAVIELPGAPSEQVARALLNRGVTYGQTGDTQRSIEDYTAVIELPGAPSEQVAKALLNRGVTYGETGETQKSIEDCTAVIELPGASSEQVAHALINRGITYGKTGETQKSIEGYTAVIELPGAPREQVAHALLNRGITYGQTGETQREIEDYTAIIELSGAPSEQVAHAFFNRGITYGKTGETQREIEDYTAIIELPGAPIKHIAKALINRGITYGHTGETQREIEGYTAVIELPGAPSEQVAKALLNRGITYGQTGDTQREIEDYTAIIELSGAPSEQVAKALLNRGVTYGKIGETLREIEGYTAIIELPGAPTEQVAKALLNRGITSGKTGETQRSIEDYTAIIELPGASSEQVAKALLNRGITYGQTGETQRSIEDYTAVIELPGASSEQVAHALFNRGVSHFLNSKMREAQADFKVLINLQDAPSNIIIDTHAALSELFFSEGRWDEGFKSLKASLECGSKVQPAYQENAKDLIGVIFSAGLNAGSRCEKVAEILRLYSMYQALPVLGEAVVQHIGGVFRVGEPFPSADNLDSWLSAWEQAAETVPDFRLSFRLLKTIIEFLKAGGKERAVLLDLASAERSIVEQALGLVGEPR